MTAYTRAKLLYRLQYILGGMAFGAACMAILWVALALDCLVRLP